MKNPLRLWTIGNAVFLLVIWAVERWGGERQLFAFLVSYAPQFLFVLPGVILQLVAAIRRRQSLALANFAAFACATVLILGLHYHVPNSSITPNARIMTFNVEKWSHGSSQVATVIQRFHPDCFCLQEAGDYPYVSGHPQEELQALLPDYHVIWDGEIGIGSRTPILSHRSYPLLPGADSRPVLMADVTLLNRPVTIVAVHLLPSFMRNVQFVRKYGNAKLTQVNEILTDLKSIQAPIILCGDMNAQPQTGTCHLLDAHYTDAFNASGSGFGYTIMAQFPTSRIDHIYLGNGATALHAFVPNVIASDHRPLIADIRLQ